MKKFISILAALAVVTACSVVGFATEVSFEVPAELTNKYEKVEGLYEVDLTKVAGSQEQTTILAVKGNTISVGTIEYIGQSEVPVFNFDLRNTLNAGETVYVLAGGSDITAQVVGYMAEEATEPELPPVEKITISGTVSGWAGTTLPTVKVYNGEAEVATAEVTAGTAAGTANFTVVVDELAEGSYTLKATKAGYLSYTKGSVDPTTAVTATLKFGDIDGNGEVGIDDVGGTILKYKASSAVAESGYEVVYDADENGEIGIDDVGTIILNYKSQAKSE